MLESMAKSPRPTRAEVSDVTNAVYDGADCVMLSGETAKGKFPTETVKFMNEIILSAERYAASDSVGHPAKPVSFLSPKSDDGAIAKAAVTAAHERDCSAILVLTNHGTLPPLVSANRPKVPIIAFCPTAKIGRLLQVYRGIHPVVNAELAGAGVSPAKRAEHAVEDAKRMGYIEAGDEVVIVSMDDDDYLGKMANMMIVTVP
jgi:pyruvate kinase